MADRPRSGRSGDGSSGEPPEFGWLYDGSDDGSDAGGADPTRPVPRQGRRDDSRTPRPDETRMMRTQPRPTAGGEQPSRQPSRQPGQQSGQRPGVQRTRPTPPPVAPPPGPPPGRSGGGGRRPRIRTIRRVVLLLLAAWLVFTIVVPFLAWNKVQKVDWEPSGERPADQPGTTYLLVGSDSRAGLSAAERRKYKTGNPQENLSDTIMLLHTGSGPNVLLSIPRDSIVDVPGYGSSKINSAYARGGPQLLTQVIEQNTGVRVDDYVEIGLGGVASVVDAVGGVEICPEYKMVDKDAGLNVKKGCQEADGRVALAYSRSRHAQRNGDLDRVKHQREVVSAIGTKVLSPWSVVNSLRWWRLNNAMPDFFTFGSGMSTLGAGKWATAMAHTSGSSGKTCTMPVTDGSANTWDESRAKPLLNTFITDTTDKITADQCTPAGIVGAQ